MGRESIPFQEYFKLFRKKWTMYVMIELFHENKGFQDLYNNAPGVSPKVLHHALIELEGMGLISKEIIQERPKLTEYSLTEKGRDTKPFFKEFLIFLIKYSDGGMYKYDLKEKLKILES